MMNKGIKNKVLTALLIVVLSAVPGCDLAGWPENEAKEAAAAPSEPDHYWWVEINYPGIPDLYDGPMQSLHVVRKWAKPIVTTRPSEVERLYLRLSEDLHGAPVTPGVKLQDNIWPFDEIRRACKLTGSSIIVIEAEGVCGRGTFPPIADCVLPDCVTEAWLWPAIRDNGTTDKWEAALLRQARLLAKDDRWRFISHRKGWAPKSQYTAWEQRSKRITGMVLADPLDIYYVGDRYVSKGGYSTESASKLAGGIYYPGATYALETANALNRWMR